jgi:hypothetical protein
MVLIAVLNLVLGLKRQQAGHIEHHQQPALQQTEGVIWDPLTPFQFEVDEGTGLPIGRPKLSSTNQRLINSGLFIHRGRNAGQRVTDENSLQQDIQAIDGALVLDMVRTGMDIARINCAHDSAAQWVAMADHVRAAAR